MVTCERCDCNFDPAVVPGGQCPRCLLLGMHEDEFIDLEDEDAVPEPATALEDDELAAELPGFELEQRIGRGGMGVVWRARERVLDRHVAIKLVRNVERDPAFAERFTREARIMARLHHPNIVTLFSFGRTRSNHCYLVMEMVEGADLAQLIIKNALNVPAALTITSDVCDALQHAHEIGFVHRDIKPGNVLIDKDGHVKVVDFGLAKLSDKHDTDTLGITEHGWAVGTPLYAAPEQAKGKGEIDHRADIYSVGVVLYQMLTSEVPRGIFAPPSSKRKIDKRLDKIVMRALQEDPAKRYQSISELSTELQKVRRDVDPEILAERLAASHASRWRRRGEMLLAIAVAVLVGNMMAWYAEPWLTAVTTAFRPVILDGGITIEQDAAKLPHTAQFDCVRRIKLQPPGLPVDAHFGRTIAVWQDWLAIGAPEDSTKTSDGCGSVYLYERSNADAWVLRQCLRSPQSSRHYFGYQIAMRDGRLLVGAPGRSTTQPGTVNVYELVSGRHQWQSAAISLPVTEQRSHLFGTQLSISGNRLAIVDELGRNAAGERCGQLHLYAWTAEHRQWQPLALPIQDSDLAFTSAILRQDAVFGAVCRLGPIKRDAYVGNASLLWHSLTTNEFQFVSQPSVGPPLGKHFTTMAADPSTMVLGAPDTDNHRGLCWMLSTEPGSAPRSEALIDPPDELGRCEFGKAVSINDTWLAIGADHYAVDADHRGSVCLYHRSGPPPGDWQHVLTLKADSKDGQDDFGNTVAIGSQFIAVGAPRSSRHGVPAAGAVLIYEVSKPLAPP